jgi:uncharacterized protein (TIGR02271 family)
MERMKRILTALFDRYEDAAAAVRKLEAAGVPESDISLVASNADNWYSGDKTATRTGKATGRIDRDRDGVDDRAEGAGAGAGIGATIGGAAGLLAGLGLLAIPGIGPVVAAGWLASTLAGAAAGGATGGIIGALTQAGLGRDDAEVYAEGIRRGGTLVTVRADDIWQDRVIRILEENGTVDVDERERSWRSAGWTPERSGAAAAATQSTSERQERIPLTEEELKIGKREVGKGHVRVHSRIVEEPVHEQVTLKDEKVKVERRPVDRPLTAGEDTFRERTIEATEKREEPVVSKEARVKEEVILKKQPEQRTETVTDKVRRTEVEVEDQRGRAGTTRTGTKR